MRKKFNRITIQVIALVLTASTQAVNADREKDHEELRGLRKELVAAIQEKDIDKLAACFTSTFAFTASDQTTVTNKEQLKAYYEKLLANKNSPLKDVQVAAEAEVETIFVGSDSGYVYGRSMDTFTLIDDSTLSVNNKWTAFVTKEDGKWKVAAVHVGVNFYDNPVIDKINSFNKISLCGVALVSLLIGVLVGRKTKK